MANTKNILCFGDQLTLGYSQGEYEPYATYLLYDLQEKVQYPVSIDTDAVEGDVTSKMQVRLDQALAKKNYNLCIIIAGSNDLSNGISAQTVLQNLIQLHNHCHKRGVYTIAVTIPQFQQIEAPEYKQRREVRLYIRENLIKYSNESNKRCFIYDLYQSIPFTTQFEDLWSDHANFSADGYSQISKQLAILIQKNDYLGK